MRKAVEEIKKKVTIQTNLKGSECIKKFSFNSPAFRKFIYSVIWINDKICTAALRDILDMKMLAESLSNQVRLIGEPRIKDVALLWFGSKHVSDSEALGSQLTQESETTGASGSIGTLNQFVKIFEDKEPSQDLSKSIDNRSQFSDFSLKFSQFQKKREDFFDF